jgi:sec-independent protein translocase protein TatA
MLHLALPSGPEIWVILLIVLVFFGGRKLPELARAAGSSITQFKKGLKEGEQAIDETKDDIQKD